MSVTIESDVAISELSRWEEVLLWAGMNTAGLVLRVAYMITIIDIPALGVVVAEPLCAALSTSVVQFITLLVTAIRLGQGITWNKVGRVFTAAVIGAVSAAIWERRLGPFSGSDTWSDVFGEIAASVGATRHQVRFADMNGDGREDHLVVGDQGQVRAWANNRGGGSAWSSRGEIPNASTTPTGVAPWPPGRCPRSTGRDYAPASPRWPEWLLKTL